MVEAAVSDSPGRERFWEQKTSFLASRLEKSPRREDARFGTPVRAREVRALTLDDFCRARRVEPDVIKVDVEGGETAVLRGARGLLRRRRAVIFLEVHHALLEQAGDGADDVFAELVAAGWTWREIHAEPAGTRHYVCRASA